MRVLTGSVRVGVVVLLAILATAFAGCRSTLEKAYYEDDFNERLGVFHDLSWEANPAYAEAMLRLVEREPDRRIRGAALGSFTFMTSKVHLRHPLRAKRIIEPDGTVATRSSWGTDDLDQDPTFVPALRAWFEEHRDRFPPQQLP